MLWRCAVPPESCPVMHAVARICIKADIDGALMAFGPDANVNSSAAQVDTADEAALDAAVRKLLRAANDYDRSLLHGYDAVNGTETARMACVHHTSGLLSDSRAARTVLRGTAPTIWGKLDSDADVEEALIRIQATHTDGQPACGDIMGNGALPSCEGSMEELRPYTPGGGERVEGRELYGGVRLVDELYVWHA